MFIVMRQTHITQRYNNKNMRYNNSKPNKLKKTSKTSKNIQTNKNIAGPAILLNIFIMHRKN